MAAACSPALSVEPDEVLAARAVAGDSAAFGELYRRHAVHILGFIRGRVRSTEDAEDLTQLVFLKAWRAIARFRAGEAPFFAWLLVIAANTVVSAHRAQWRHAAAPLPAERADGTPADTWEDQVALRLDAAAWLKAALPRLQPLQRRVLLLRFAEGLDHAEVAQRVGRTSAAVRVIQYRALSALRALDPARLERPSTS